jgi:predicted RNA-binding protein with PUA-like domain
MNYWLIKSGPSCFSFDDMAKKRKDSWDGVKNYTARNFMRKMELGDLCLFYHSNCNATGIVSLVKVIRAAYQDPTDNRFSWIDVEYQKSLPFLSLHFLKTIQEISRLPLFHQSRLSAQPVDEVSAKIILNLAVQITEPKKGKKN